jgi:hypothetical protein
LHNKIFSIEHPRLQIHKLIKTYSFHCGKETHKIKEEKNGLPIKDPTPL